LLALHRKVHLFDMHIPGKISFLESSVLSPGSQVTVVETEFGKVGIGICHDVRFPEMAMVAARRGAFAMVYPGAFNMATGPVHWELLARARAVDNQVFVVMCSTARCGREEGAKGAYVAFGNSLVVAPDGGVVARTDEMEGVVECTLLPAGIDEARAGIPVTVQRRFDVYGDVAVVPPSEVRGGGG
jgi:predicted amidohydrolase